MTISYITPGSLSEDSEPAPKPKIDRYLKKQRQKAFEKFIKEYKQRNAMSLGPAMKQILYEIWLGGVEYGNSENRG